ncbi:MAG: LamG-like jellyroll fold domain-containing protein, partial [Candidatus Pacearchaeota archaeon]
DLFSFGTPTTADLFNILYDYTNEGLYFGGYSYDAAGTTYTINRNQWNFVAVTFDSTYVKVYINGNLAPNINSNRAGLTTSASKLYIGRSRETTPSYYHGAIDNFLVLNRSLSAAETVDIYNLGRNDVSYNDSSLVSAWRFDDSFYNSSVDSLGLNNGTFNSAGVFYGYDSFGLLAYYPFDVLNSSSNEYDYSLNNYDGTLVGTTYNSSCLYSGCRMFNGINNYISLTIPGIKNSSTLWIKNSTSASWTFIARNDTSYFVNGVVGVPNQYPINITNGNVKIGINESKNQYFNGSIDEVMLFNFPLSPLQILEIYNNQSKRFVSQGIKSLPQPLLLGSTQFNLTLSGYSRIQGTNLTTRLGAWDVSLGYNNSDMNSSANGLVSYYHFDEAYWSGVAGEVKDAMGINDGSINGGVNTSSSGYYYRAGNFDGSNDYVNIGSGSSLNIAGNLTISVWIKTSDSTYDFIVGGYNPSSPNQGYALSKSGVTTNKLSVWMGGPSWITGSTSVADGNWHHVGISVFGTNCTLYVDGKQDANGVITGLTSYTGVKYIGQYTGGGNYYFNGSIDEVMIFNRSLSTEEITELYVQGRALWNYTEYQNLSEYDSVTSSSANLFNISYFTTRVISDFNLSGEMDYSFYTPSLLTDSLPSYTRFVPDYINFTYPSEVYGTLYDSAFTDSILVNVSSNMSESDLQGTSIISVNLYNSTMNLVNNSNSSTSPYFVNFSELENGLYYFNAVAYNFVGSPNSTEMRRVIINSAPSPNYNVTREANFTHLTLIGDTSNTLRGFNLLPKPASPIQLPYFSGDNENSYAFFDGANDYININTAFFNNPSGGTNSLWVYPKSNGIIGAAYQFPTFWCKGNIYMELGLINTNKVRAYTYTGAVTTFDSNTPLTINQWNHVAIEWNSTGSRIYINGQLDATSPTVTYAKVQPAHVNGLFYLGSNVVPAYPFNGSMDNILFLNRSLNSSEILSIYDLGRNDVGYTDPSLVSAWRFDNSFNSLAIDSQGLNNGTFSNGAGYSHDSFGLVAYYPFDIVNMSIVEYDYSLNNYDGTLVGTTYNSSCLYSGCRMFNGVNSYINIGVSETKGSSTLWIKNSTADSWTFIAKNDTSYFVNGVVGVPNQYPINITNGNVKIGINESGSQYFEGMIDEVMLFNIPLNSSQILDIYNNHSRRFVSSGIESTKSVKLDEITSSTNVTLNGYSRASGTNLSLRLGAWDVSLGYNNSDMNSSVNGLVSYYHFDEAYWSGVAGEVKDAMNKNNGVRVGAANVTSAGYYSNAGSFNGVNSYVSVTSTTGLPSGNVAKSISAWAKFDNTCVSKLCNIGGFGTASTSANFQFGSTAAGAFAVWGWGADWITPFTTASVVGTWHHFVVTYNGSTTILYVDGNNQSTTTAYSWTTNPSRVVIGNEIDLAGQEFNGSIDEFMIFNRSLSSNEVQELYTRGRTLWNYTEYQNLSEYNSIIPGAANTFSFSNTTTNLLPDFNLLADLESNFYTPALMTRSRTDVGIGCDAILPTYANFNDSTTASGVLYDIVITDSIIVNATSNQRCLSNLTINLYNATMDLINSSISSTNQLESNFSGLEKGLYFFNAVAANLAGNSNSSEMRNVMISNVSLPNSSISEGDGFTYLKLIGDSNPLKGFNLLRRIPTSQLPYFSNDGNNSYAVFEGVNSYVNVGDSNSLDLTTSGTVAFWAKKYSQKYYQMYVTKGISSASTGYQVMDYDTTGRVLVRWGSDSNNLISVNSVPLENWTFVVATYNSSQLAIYFNGVLDNSVGYSTNALANTDPLRIGSRSDGYYFNGSMDNVMILNRALNSSEISDLYALGRDEISYNDYALVSAWRFDNSFNSLAIDSLGLNNGTFRNASYGYDGFGLIAYYPMDLELSTTAEYDYSMNHNHGVLSGTTHDFFCVYSGCREFNGLTDKIIISNAGEISSSTLWIKDSSASVWTFIAKNDTTYFVNGAVGVPDYYPINVSGNNINLGVNESGNEFFEGLIDEVMLFNVNLSSSQILDIYNNQSTRFMSPGNQVIKQVKVSQGTSQINLSLNGYAVAQDSNAFVRLGAWDVSRGYNNSDLNGNNGLVSYWHFDEGYWDGTAGEVKDALGKNNGTAQNITKRANTTVTGVYQRAGKFDGKNSYINATDSSSLDIVGNISLGAWVYPTSYSGLNDESAIISKRDTNTANYHLSLGPYASRGSAPCFGFYNGAWYLYCGPNNLTLNQWHYVFATYDMQYLSIYVDGVLVSNNPESHAMITNNYPLVIGMTKTPQYTFKFNGSIDEVMIFNRSLLANEVKELYVGGRALWNYTDYQTVNPYYVFPTTFNPFIIPNTTTNVLRDFNLTSDLNYSFYSPTLTISSVGSQELSCDGTWPVYVNFTYPTGPSGSIYDVVIQDSIFVNVSSNTQCLNMVTVNLYNSTQGLIMSSSSQTTPYSINFTDLVNGTYYINATVYNIAGNSNSTETRAITLKYFDSNFTVTSPETLNPYNYFNITTNLTCGFAQCTNINERLDYFDSVQLENGGFELGDFTNWTRWSATGSANATISISEYFNDSYYSLNMLTTPDRRWQNVNQTFTSTSPAYLCFWIKGSLTTYSSYVDYFDVYVINSSSTASKLVNSYTNTNWADWTRLCLNLTPYNPVNGVLLQAYDAIVSSNPNNNIYIDDVCLADASQTCYVGTLRVTDSTLISNVSSSIPFYLNGTNPISLNSSLNLIKRESQEVNWFVNSTGKYGSEHTLIAYVNLTGQGRCLNSSQPTTTYKFSSSGEVIDFVNALGLNYTYIPDDRTTNGVSSDSATIATVCQLKGYSRAVTVTSTYFSPCTDSIVAKWNPSKGDFDLVPACESNNIIATLIC